MGGASCKHLRTEVLKINNEYTKNKLWTYRVTTEKCLDCPAELKLEKCIGRITGHEYSTEMVDPKNCDHVQFEVDQSTIEERTKTTLGGSLLRLFMGPNLNGIQYSHFLVAKANCKRCDFQFYVQSGMERVWKDQKQIVQSTGNWQPLMQKVPNGTYYKEDYVTDLSK